MQGVYRGLFGSSYYYNNYIEKDDIDNGYSIFNIYDTDDTDDNLNKEYKDNENNEQCDEENCVTCYHSNGKYCSMKNIDINKYSPICWSYRDSITMKPCSDFQFDEDIDEEY